MYKYIDWFGIVYWWWWRDGRYIFWFRLVCYFVVLSGKFLGIVVASIGIGSEFRNNKINKMIVYLSYSENCKYIYKYIL